jgi:CHAT domain-containing protein
VKNILLLLLLFFFIGCSFQATVIDQNHTLKRIKNSEYDFSIVKTEKEKVQLLQKLNIMHYSLHKVRELIEASYLKPDILVQLDYEKIYNGLEQLTQYYSKDMKLFSKAMLVANDALYFAQLNLKREKKSKTIVRAYSNISMVYREDKQYTKALKHINVSIGRAKRTLKKSSVTLADSYYQKSLIFFLMKNYKTSIDYLNKSIKIVESLEENRRVNLMVYYSQLSKSYSADGQNNKSKLSLEKMSKLINYKVSRVHTKEEKIVLHDKIDRKIEDILKMKKGIERSILSKNRFEEIDYINAYNFMYSQTISFRKKGEFVKALKLAESSLFFAKIISNKKESTYSIKSYNSLSHIYMEMEYYSKALKYVRKAISSSKEALEKKSSILADSYREEALIYQAMNQYSKAIKSINNAISIAKIEENQKVLIALKNYATPKNKSRHAKVRYSSKLKKLKKILFQTKQEYGEYHYKTAEVYSKIAKLNLSEGWRLDNAVMYAREAHKINKKVFGRKSSKFIDSSILLSNIYFLKYKREKAYLFSKESVDAILEARKSLFLELSSNAKLDIKKFNIDYFLLFAYLHIEELHDDYNNKKADKISKEVFNIWLRYKNEITNQESYLIALKEKNRDSKVRLKIDNLIQVKKEYSKLFLKKISNPDIFLKDEEKRIVKLKEQQDELEASLSSKISVYRDSLNLEDVNSFTISQKLKKGEVYIDFAHIKENNSYFSFILNDKGKVSFDIVNPQPNLIEQLLDPIIGSTFNLAVDALDLVVESFVGLLFGSYSGSSSKKEEKEDDSYVPLDRLVKKFREDILEEKLKKKNRHKKNFNKKNAKKIYQVLFPKRSNLTYKENPIFNAKKLIISPDGVLNLLPFEALVINNNKYLIEDKEIIYVSSGKDFLKAYQEKNSLTNNSDIVVLSYLDYNNTNGTIKRIGNIEQTKSLVNDGAYVKNLTDTKDEAQNIKDIFSQENVHTYSGKAGTKEMLFSLHSPKILHLSTHSFYGVDDNNSVDPLLKSGMALSGYNNYVPKLDTRGIMSALEFSSLNLYNTELVLFSSCQSGRGDIHSSEGVYGLNRGAKLAGAKRVISTLWSVDSEASLELTNRFYEHLKENNMKGYADALRGTKEEMIKKDYHPFFWAGFVENGID